jgi:uncharacterized protein YceH (UPF0502 family)
MEEFSGVDEVMSVIESLMEREDALVIRIPKGPGSREDRFTHLLCGEVDIASVVQKVTSTGSSKMSKIDELESRIELLEAQMKQLLADQG